MAFGITAFSQAAIASLGGGIANANGQNINTSQGSVTVDLNTIVNVTGQSITSAQGNVSISSGDSVILTGIGLTNSLNSVSTTGTGKVTVTGQSTTSTLGTAVLNANTFATVSGEAMTAAEGTVDPSPDASVTGIGISASLAVGTVVIGTGSVELTGQELAASNTISVQGTLKAFAALPFATQSSRFIQTGNVTVSADANTGVTGEVLLQLCEYRLDNVVYRFGLSTSTLALPTFENLSSPAFP